MSEQRSGAEKLRAVVGWIDWQNETFLDRFEAEELIKLWEYGEANEGTVDEHADTWTEEQIARALGHCGANEDSDGAHLICMLRAGHIGSHNTAPDDSGDHFGWVAGRL